MSERTLPFRGASIPEGCKYCSVPRSYSVPLANYYRKVERSHAAAWRLQNRCSDDLATAHPGAPHVCARQWSSTGPPPLLATAALVQVRPTGLM